MESIWTALAKEHSQSQSTLPNDCDVCIIGAGLTGLYSAVLLAQKGLNVIVLEASNKIGYGATSFSTGKLTIQHGAILQKLVPEVRKLYVEENEQAIERFTNLLPDHYFTERTAFLYSQTPECSEQLKREYAIYEELKIPTFATNETELPFAVDLAIAIKNQYEFNPYEIQLALVELAEQLGVQVFTGHRVHHIDHVKKSVTVCEQTLQFKDVIIATHYPIDAFPALQIMKLANSRSYLCAAPIVEPFDGYYLNIAKQSRTIRTATINEQHYILYGGTNHLAGTSPNPKQYYKTIEQELHQHFEVSQIPYAWSNQDVETFDQLPLIGKIDANIYVATGYRKWGLSQSLVAAELLTKKIINESHPLQPYVSPQRLKILPMLQTAGFTLAQFLNGYINRPSAPICTHLGCKTRWNKADDTWDCPCHGSRFSSDGSVIEGPAVEPLKIRKQ